MQGKSIQLDIMGWEDGMQFTSAFICIVRAVRWRTAGDHDSSA